MEITMADQAHHEFKPGDRVEYIEPSPAEMTSKLGTVTGEPTRLGRVPITWDKGTKYHKTNEPPQYLRFIEPEPTPAEPTDEQRAAVEWLVGAALGGYTGAEAAHAQALLAALPDALTNPQPVLPNEPGLYVGPGGTRGPVWRLDVEALRYDGGAPNVYREGGHDKATPADGPFTRLVLERPPVTAEQVRRCTRGNLLRPAEVVALVKLANGTPDE